MKPSFKLLAAAVLVAGAHLALAQPPKASFVDTFAEMQALSSNSSQWQSPQPSFARGAAAPRSALSLSDYQALSSNSPQWQFDQGRIGVDSGPTFAQTHPAGIPFAEYQALSANSGQYAIPDGRDASSMVATGGANISHPSGSTFRARLTRLFHGGNAASIQDD